MCAACVSFMYMCTCIHSDSIQSSQLILLICLISLLYCSSPPKSPSLHHANLQPTTTTDSRPRPPSPPRTSPSSGGGAKSPSYSSPSTRSPVPPRDDSVKCECTLSCDFPSMSCYLPAVSCDLCAVSCDLQLVVYFVTQHTTQHSIAEQRQNKPCMIVYVHLCMYICVKFHKCCSLCSALSRGTCCAAFSYLVSCSNACFVNSE